MTESFLYRLHSTLKNNPLQRKVLVASSFAEGHMWLERISREYGPVMNTEIQTLSSLAASLAALRLSEQELRIIDEQESFWTVYSIMKELSAMPDAYVSETLLTPGVIHAFHKAIHDLRHAGLTVHDLRLASFEHAAKGKYVIELLRRYEELLTTGKIIDSAGLLRYAEAPTVPMPYILHEHVAMTAAQSQILHKLAGDHLIILEADLPFTETLPVCTFFHAAGPMTEVEEVFRRAAEHRIPWDQIEIIASDYTQYATAVHTYCDQHDISCTFSGGLPVDFTAQGQAAKLYLSWIESNYKLDALLTGFKQGLFRIGKIPTLQVIRTLEKSGIGWGRERYTNWIQARLHSVEESDDDNAAIIAQWLDQLLTDLPASETDSPTSLLRGLTKFLERDVICPNEEERLLRVRLNELAGSMGEVKVNDTALTLRYVSDLLVQLTCYAEGMPQAGCLYVSSLQDGGISGRPYTFIIGMNESAWSTTAVQDPVLLDVERIAISPNLQLSSVVANERIRQRNSRLAMIGGSCMLSFSSFDLTDNREIHPSFEMLQIYRKQSGNENADFEDMMEDMGTMRGYALLSNGSYHHLENGRAAIAARADLPMSSYDGMLQPLNEPVNPEISHLSLSRLEQFGRCSLLFYYTSVLEIWPKDTAAFNRDQWLDPMQRGSLLHDIYCTYYSELQGRHKDGSLLVHNHQLLFEVTERVINIYTDSVPAPSPHIWRRECEGIRRDMAMFYTRELENTHTLPRFLEYPIHDGDEPFIVHIADDVKLPLKGFVDRIDEIAPHQYKIYDYKTGKSSNYREQDYYAGGKQLQHAIYALAVEQKLRSSGIDPQAEVKEAAYLFPTERGLGNEVNRLQNHREQLSELIRHMLKAMNDGVYPPALDPKACTYCDFKDVCGSHADWMKVKAAEQSNQDILKHVLAVNGYA